VVTVDGTVVWDKKRRDGDRFPAPDEILRQLPAQ
jgi:predicted Rdx family selenoprotein